MTTNYHTPMPNGAPANVEEVNAPLGELDEAITSQALQIAVLDGRADDLEADMPVPSGNPGEYYDSEGGWTVPAGTGVTNGHVIQDEGVDVTQRANLNFVGAGVEVTNEAGGTQVTINGGGDMAKSVYDPDDDGVIAIAQGGTGAATQADARTALGLGTSAVLDIDTDSALAANSDAKIATQKAVKAYADALIAANDAMVYKGVIDCSTNPNYPAADSGHTYRVSVAGKIGGASGANVEIGDLLICLADGTSSGTQAGVGSNWSIVQANIDGAVIGPASSTNGNIATFSGTTGKNIQDGGKALPSGSLVGASDSQSLTNKDLKASTNVIEELTTATSAASHTMTGGSLRNRLKVTAQAAAVTFNAPSGTPVDGNMLLIQYKDNGTSRAITWNSIFDGYKPTATVAGKWTIIVGIYNSTISKYQTSLAFQEA